MTVLTERYELGRPLGSGGMARVVAGYDRVLGRPVAVKLIHESLAGDPTSRERLLREARAAAALHHPHTVAVFDTGEQDGRPFIVMELVEGRSLADRLRDEGPLPVENVGEIADAVLSALGAAHGRGLVHRDVKPSNILLPDAGGVKLSDFGIATALAEVSTLTATGQVLGTARYLAPECVAGQPASPASDLYSLGAVLYECLTGRAPFDRGTPVATAVAHQHDPVRPLAGVAPHVPAGMAAAVERALAKDPAARFAGTDDMRRALRSPAAEVDRTASFAAAAQTRALDVQRPEPAGGGGRRPWMALAAVALLAVAAGLGYLLTRALDDETEQAQPDPPVAEGAPDAAANPPDDEEAPSDAAEEEAGDGAAASLEELIAALGDDPEEFGEKGDDLLEDLQKVQAEPAPPKRAEEARKLVEEIADWMADAKLDRATGAEAVRLLEADSSPDDPALEVASALFAEVATTLPEWDEKGEDLLSDLGKLLEANNTNQRSDRAAELVHDIEEWIDKNEIDAVRAGRALDVLRPLAGEG